MRVYADNAATTKMSAHAIEVAVNDMENAWGNPSSLHSTGQTAMEKLTGAREKFASLIGAKPSEIYFTSGGSESDNQAIMSAAMLGIKKGKKHIVSTKFEHHAVLHTLEKLKKQGFDITLVDVHDNGIVNPKEIESAIREDTTLVSIMFANNEIGTVQPISDIGKICRERGVLFHTDAVQAAGHIKINVNELNVDMLSMSAHKFKGPKGVGILYARKGVALTNIIEGGAQERGKRAGTENVPYIDAAATAYEDAVLSIDENNTKVLKMRERLIDGLLKIPHSRLNGDRYNRLCGNANFCFEGIEGESLLLMLDDLGIEASSGSACTSGSLDPSHVLLAIGLPHDVAHGSLRLTINEDNTDEQIDYMIKSVAQVVERLRSMSPVWQDLCEGKRNHLI
ncbi:MAG: IscS subfamily cysteine desulfurase [Eubacteriales bacterium]|nr:IscS subfamily cysteine desulfurase [Eubacteriales bacterium]